MARGPVPATESHLVATLPCRSAADIFPPLRDGGGDNGWMGPGSESRRRSARSPRVHFRYPRFRSIHNCRGKRDRDPSQCKSGARPATARHDTSQPPVRSRTARRRGRCPEATATPANAKSATRDVERYVANPSEKERAPAPAEIPATSVSARRYSRRVMLSSGFGLQLYSRAGIAAVRRGRGAQVFVDRNIDSASSAGTPRLKRPLAVRCGAFGDMVLLTALIRVLHARFHSPVDIVTSGPWSEPLLRGQPGVGEIWSLRSRKTPYWLSADQRRVVRRLRDRGVGPTWFCDASDAARPLLARAGIPEEFIVDVRDHSLLPGEHATEQWRRLAQVTPVAIAAPSGAGAPAAEAPAVELRDAELAAVTPGCHLEVSERQRSDLEAWLRARGLSAAPLILIQIGNKRTMRRGLRRLAVNNKYWPNERWAEGLRHVRRQHPDHAIVLLGTGPEYALNQEVAVLADIARL